MFGFWNKKVQKDNINDEIISTSPSEQYDIESACISENKINKNQISICVEYSDNNEYNLINSNNSTPRKNSNSSTDSSSSSNSSDSQNTIQSVQSVPFVPPIRIDYLNMEQFFSRPPSANSSPLNLPKSL